MDDETAGAAPRIWLDYGRPDAALADFVSGYHFFEVETGGGPAVEDFNYPAWTLLRFMLGGAPLQARIGGGRVEVPPAALFGTTSRAAHIRTTGGLMVGAGVTPLGWARLFGGDASAWTDRVVPLSELIGGEAEALRGRLRAARDEAGWTAVFDDWFRARLTAAPPLPRDIVEIHRLLLDPETQSVERIAAEVGVTARHVGRISTRVFGLPPKVLMRRARFLRAAMPLRAADPRTLPERVSALYPDYAQFARDCQAFLGMSPTAFLAHPRPISDASTTQRLHRLGAPAQALHAPV